MGPSDCTRNSGTNWACPVNCHYCSKVTGFDRYWAVETVDARTYFGWVVVNITGCLLYYISCFLSSTNSLYFDQMICYSFL